MTSVKNVLNQHKIVLIEHKTGELSLNQHKILTDTAKHEIARRLCVGVLLEVKPIDCFMQSRPFPCASSHWLSQGCGPCAKYRSGSSVT